FAWWFSTAFLQFTVVAGLDKARNLAQAVVRLKEPLLNKALVFALSAIVISLANADQGSFTNSGGTSVAGAGVTISSSVASPAGTLNLYCPETSAAVCAGGNFIFSSMDGTSSLNATFSSGKFVEGCSGGGRGGHVTCSWTFTGYFSGTWTLDGETQAINGFT